MVSLKHAQEHCNLLIGIKNALCPTVSGFMNIQILSDPNKYFTYTSLMNFQNNCNNNSDNDGRNNNVKLNRIFARQF